MLKQVTLGAATVGTIVTPGPGVRLILLQNSGANPVNLTFDGGSTYQAPNGKVGTDPNGTTLGYTLAAGASLPFIQRDVGGNSLALPIRGFSTLGTTINVCTDDTNSS